MVSTAWAEIMHDLDKRILNHVLDRAIEKGAFISVNDGEAFCLAFTQNKTAIFKALEQTDIELIYFSATNVGVVSYGPNALGRIALVHGNSPGEIIADYLETDFIKDILDGAPEE